MNTEMQRRLVTPFVRGLVICLLGASGLAVAATISEIEPNDAIGAAQPVSVPLGGLSISAVIGQIGGGYNTDVDFFTFHGTQGDTPSISTVGALNPDGTGACAGFPSNLALYDSAGNLLGSAAADCPSLTEALLNSVTLLATGTYVVAVSSWTHYFGPGGSVENLNMPTPGGPYQLVIRGVRDSTPAPPPAPAPTPVPTLPPPSSAKHVPIEVRHWHQDERDLEKRDNRDPITVVIFSMADFDAMKVDAKSLTFGAKGNEKSLFRCRKEGKDVNRDGLPDMVCYFKPDMANFQTGHLNGILQGRTKSGQQIEGSAALKIFSRKADRGEFKHRDQGDSDAVDQKNGKDKLKK